MMATDDMASRSQDPPSPPRLLLAGLSPETGQSIAHPYAAAGWRIVHAADGAELIAAARLWRFDLILHGPLPPPIDIMTVRRCLTGLADPAIPTTIPILTAKDAPPPAPHPQARPEEAPRPDPMARLLPLLGPAGAVHLMRRLQSRLTALRDAPDPYAIGEGSTLPSLAHRMGGVAGTLGFADLASAWFAVEIHGPDRLADAWIETRIAQAMLAFLLLPVEEGLSLPV